MKRLVIALVVLCALLATFLAVNGPMVLTGRLADRPLALISGGPAIAAAAGIWSDTDAACGAAPRADPDDCFAIVWLLAQGADVIGISTSSGNAAGDVVAATVTGLAAALAQPSPQVYTGYVAPADAGAGAGTDAAPAPPGVIALQAALAEGPLTILALGPLTNIAAALQERPDLQANVTRLVAVMGHRPGHLFHAAEGRGNGVAWGHGPIFRDLNVAVDTKAVTEVLALGLPLTLIPYDAATGTLITADDLDRLASQSAGMAYVSRTAQSWLAFWRDDVGLPGFFPFDWIAAAYLVDPTAFDCTLTNARLVREWAFWVLPRRGLLIGPDPDDLTVPSGQILYCPRTAARVHAALLAHP